MHLDPITDGKRTEVIIPRVPIMLLRQGDKDVGTIARFMSGWCVISTSTIVQGQGFIGMELSHHKDVIREHDIEHGCGIYEWLMKDPWDETFVLRPKSCTVLHSGVPVLEITSRRSRRGDRVVEYYARPTVQCMDAPTREVLGGDIQITYKTAIQKLGIPREALERLSKDVR
jgi:hypothetical protein